MIDHRPQNHQIDRIRIWLGAVLFSMIPGVLLSQFLYASVFALASAVLRLWYTNPALGVATVRFHWPLIIACAALSGLLISKAYAALILRDHGLEARWWIWAGAIITICTTLIIHLSYIA